MVHSPFPWPPELLLFRNAPLLCYESPELLELAVFAHTKRLHLKTRRPLSTLLLRNKAYEAWRKMFPCVMKNILSPLLLMRELNVNFLSIRATRKKSLKYLQASDILFCLRSS